MTMTVEIRPEVEAALARQAAGHGYALEAYVAMLLAEAIQDAPEPGKERADAIERLKTFGQRHGLSLGGVTIRELRDEARP